MAYFVKGTKFSYNVANQTIKQLGLNLTDQTDDKEIRVKIITGRYKLIINDSGTDKIVGGDTYLTEVVRTDTDSNVSAHTEWQNGYQIRFGNNNDTNMLHNGTDFYFSNNNGMLVLKQLDKTKDIYIKAKDENDQILNMLQISAQNTPPIVKSAGAIISTMKTIVISNNGIHDTGIPRLSVGYIYIKHGNLNDSRSGAVYAIGIYMTLNNGTQRIRGDNTYWSDTKDSVSVNVYAESTGNVKIQNISGVSITLHYGFLGGYIP